MEFLRRKPWRSSRGFMQKQVFGTTKASTVGSSSLEKELSHFPLDLQGGDFRCIDVRPLLGMIEPSDSLYVLFCLPFQPPNRLHLRLRPKHGVSLINILPLEVLLETWVNPSNSADSRNLAASDLGGKHGWETFIQCPQKKKKTSLKKDTAGSPVTFLS